jgi:glycerol-3-phosphate dehydrogenase
MPSCEPVLERPEQASATLDGTIRIVAFTPRDERLASLEKNFFDLLVIGGGITGAAVARDAASRGLSVALVERDDWASGTSWRSSKLVHGGLRYLRAGKVHLVFESLAERARLSLLAPHLVWPVDFLLASLKGRWARPLVLDVGLTLYDLLALGRSGRWHRRLTRSAVLALEPLLDSADLEGGALYSDAQTDDARLTWENVLDALSLGAVTVSRLEIETTVRDETGRVRTVRARDRESGRVFSISARVVINATGPWSDGLRQKSNPTAALQLRLSKGVHLSVPSAKLPVRQPVAVPVERGRFLFAIPEGPVTLVGTTDTDFSGSPDDVAASREDVAYLLRETGAAFPSARLGADDVLATFAGLRPLVREPGASVEATSREEAITLSDAGLVTVTGGKLTTHRRMGEKVVDRVAPLLARAGVSVGSSVTRDRPFPGRPRLPMPEFLPRLIELGKLANPSLTEETLIHLAQRYGHRATEVIGLSAGNRALGRPIVDGLPDIDAEIVFAARDEDARAVSDVLIRRTHLFWQAWGQGEEAVERAADLLAGELRWTGEQRRAAIEEYAREVSRSREWSRKGGE